MALELIGGALLSGYLQVAFQKLTSTQILDFFRARKLDQKLLSKLETKLNSIHSLADDAEGDDDTQSNPECRDIGRKIVKKCKGLPLALKTMGSLLYNKSSVPEWENVFQSEIWNLPKHRCDIIPALALSYIHLPSHLKVCFAYCAPIPKDYEFKKEQLIHLWMTESLLHYCQHTKNPEEVCQQYFNDLLSRSFFQKSSKKEEDRQQYSNSPLTRSFFQQSSKKEEVFIMHDLLNDLAKYVSGDIYFRSEVGQTKKIEKVTRYFSVEVGQFKNFDGFGTLYNTERLRTFMPINRSMDYFPMHDLFSKFKFLRNLSLAHLVRLKELPDSVANLKHLRSLDLSHTKIEKLTGNICSLSHLQKMKFYVIKENY